MWILFSKILFFFKTNLSGIPSVSNSLDQDQARRSVGPDLGPNFLQRLSADDKSRIWRGKSYGVQGEAILPKLFCFPSEKDFTLEAKKLFLLGTPATILNSAFFCVSLSHLQRTLQLFEFERHDGPFSVFRGPHALGRFCIIFHKGDRQLL